MVEVGEEGGETSVMGLNLMSVFKLFVAIGIFAGGILLRRYVTHGALFLLKLVNAPQPVQDSASHLLTTPLSFATVLASFYLSAYILQPPPELDIIFANLAQTVFDLAIFWIGFQIVDPVASVWMKTSATHHSFGEEIKEIFVKIVKAIIFVFGVLAIMEVWGINVKTFLAGLGLMTGFILMATQDTIRNLFGSVVIIADKVFHKGDMIVSPEVSGIVEHFGIRLTQIRKLDTTLVFVPNAIFASTTITNLSQSKRREISWTPKLGGNITRDVVEKLINRTREFLEQNPKIANDDQKSLVHVSDVSDGTVTLMVYFHFRMMGWPEHVAAREEVAMGFKKIVTECGASFARPTRVLLSHKA